MVVIPSTLAVVTGQGEGTDPVQEIVQVTDLVQGTDRIDLTDQGLEIVQAPDLLLEAETDPGPVADLGPERDQVHGQAQVQDLVREQDQVHAQVQWIDQGQDQVRDKVVPEPVVEVPWAATRVGVLHPGTVSAVDPVDPANQEQDRQGALRAGAEVVVDLRAEVVDVAAVVVVAVAAVVVVAVDVDLKWP